MYVNAFQGLALGRPAINSGRAVRLNRHYGRLLGWQSQFDRIASFLGFTNMSPTEAVFASAVADWQAQQSGLTVDGIIGPNTWRRMQLAMGTVPAPSPAPPPAGLPALGTFARASREIDQVVSDASEAPRWGYHGSLLSSGNYRLRIQHPGPGGLNQFRRYHFRDSNKCNLFGLDMAWRSGFRVPLLDISGPGEHPRYSYPLANHLTTFAQRAFDRGETALRGRDGTQWGWMASRMPAEAINGMIAEGHLFIIVGWRRSGTGHVGIVRRVAAKVRGAGPVSDISYDGWEATFRRAQALSGRRWRTDRCGTITGVCHRDPGPSLRVFCAIHLIGLTAEPDPGRRGVQVSFVSKCRLT